MLLLMYVFMAELHCRYVWEKRDKAILERYLRKCWIIEHILFRIHEVLLQTISFIKISYFSLLIRADRIFTIFWGIFIVRSGQQPPNDRILQEFPFAGAIVGQWWHWVWYCWHWCCFSQCLQKDLDSRGSWSSSFISQSIDFRWTQEYHSIFFFFIFQLGFYYFYFPWSIIERDIMW